MTQGDRGLRPGDVPDKNLAYEVMKNFWARGNTGYYTRSMGEEEFFSTMSFESLEISGVEAQHQAALDWEDHVSAFVLFEVIRRARTRSFEQCHGSGGYLKAPWSSYRLGAAVAFALVTRWRDYVGNPPGCRGEYRQMLGDYALPPPEGTQSNPYIRVCAMDAADTVIRMLEQDNLAVGKAGFTAIKPLADAFADTLAALEDQPGEDLFTWIDQLQRQLEEMGRRAKQPEPSLHLEPTDPELAPTEPDLPQPDDPPQPEPHLNPEPTDPKPEPTEPDLPQPDDPPQPEPHLNPEPTDPKPEPTEPDLPQPDDPPQPDRRSTMRWLLAAALTVVLVIAVAVQMRNPDNSVSEGEQTASARPSATSPPSAAAGMAASAGPVVPNVLALVTARTATGDQTAHAVPWGIDTGHLSLDLNVNNTFLVEVTLSLQTAQQTDQYVDLTPSVSAAVRFALERAAPMGVVTEPDHAPRQVNPVSGAAIRILLAGDRRPSTFTAELSVLEDTDVPPPGQEAGVLNCGTNWLIFGVLLSIDASKKRNVLVQIPLEVAKGC